MYPLIKYFYVIVSCWGFVAALDNTETFVCYKEKSDLRMVQVAVAEDVKTFLEFITISHMWVDRSLLIRAILNDEKKKHYSITMPPKWGKTINLSMLKFFFEVPMDQKCNPIPIEDSVAYKYFTTGEVPIQGGQTDKIQKPPLISTKTSLIQEHLGKYAIVYVDFTGVEVNIKNETTIKEKIIAAFEPHVNFINKHASSIDEEELKTFNKIRAGEVKLDEMTDSIKFLSRILFKCHKKQVMVFVDSYDAIVNDLYFNSMVKLKPEEEEVILDFFWNFVWNLTNDNDHMFKVIFSGVIRLNFDPEFNVAEYNTALRTNMYPFYGLLSENVYSMMKFRGVGYTLRERTLDWYGGYYAMQHESEEILSGSVLKFINSQAIGNYWVPTPEAEFIFRLIKDVKFANEIKAIKDKKHVDVMKTVTIRSVRFDELRDLKKDILSQKINDFEVVMNVLHHMGYLSISEVNVPKAPSQIMGTMLNLVAPNRQILLYMEDKLKKRHFDE